MQARTTPASLEEAPDALPPLQVLTGTVDHESERPILQDSCTAYCKYHVSIITFAH